MPHIFPALFATSGYRKKGRQGFENGGLQNIFRTILCGAVSRCIHEILSIDWACISCINETWDDGFASVIMRKPSYPAARRHEGQPHADIAQLGERRQLRRLLLATMQVRSLLSAPRNTGSLPAVGVSRKKRDSITWHAGRSDGAQLITRERASHDATGLREPDESGQTTGA